MASFKLPSSFNEELIFYSLAAHCDVYVIGVWLGHQKPRNQLCFIFNFFPLVNTHASDHTPTQVSSIKESIIDCFYEMKVRHQLKFFFPNFEKKKDIFFRNRNCIWMTERILAAYKCI